MRGGGRQLIETMAGQIAVALDNAYLSKQADQARLLEASERLQSALLSSISHDLRTPLASIMGSVTTLLDEGARLDPPVRHDLLLTIHEESARLNRLVGNLLSMTRLESGGIQPLREEYGVAELVASAVDHANVPGRKVRVDLPAALPPVRVDFVLMEQVLLNLLDNAHKFSPPDSPFEIEAGVQGDFVRMSVADHGPGIRQAERDKVFDKFYRVSGTGAPGTGLGLAICKGIVEAHGGMIWAEESDGGGTRIAFTLPLK